MAALDDDAESLSASSPGEAEVGTVEHCNMDIASPQDTLAVENVKLRQELQHATERGAALSAHLVSVIPPVSVMCRMRPLESYRTGGAETLVRDTMAVDGNDISVEDASGRSRRFKVDRVLDGKSSQEAVYAAATPWVENVLLGGSSCVFAYGATGSGKTFSLLGSSCGSATAASCRKPGLAHNALQRLIDSHDGGDARVSMVEVYCEQVRDLLGDLSDSGDLPALSCSRRDAHGRIVLDCVELVARSFVEAENILRRGYANRATDSTRCNDESSRSHVILTVRMTPKSGADLVVGGTGGTGSTVGGGRLVLIDLAGSENVQRSGADEGGKLLAEAKAINRSLSELANVVEALAKQQSFVPYRNTRLTMLMEEALCTSKVLLLVHVSPLACNATDSSHSLQFAGRVRAVDFGALRLRQDQEERLRAAQLRNHKESRQLQLQVEQLQKERDDEAKAKVEARQQAAQLTEQLREKQREVTRCQELLARAEESSRKSDNKLSHIRSAPSKFQRNASNTINRRFRDAGPDGEVAPPLRPRPQGVLLEDCEVLSDLTGTIANTEPSATPQGKSPKTSARSPRVDPSPEPCRSAEQALVDKASEDTTPMSPDAAAGRGRETSPSLASRVSSPCEQRDKACSPQSTLDASASLHSILRKRPTNFAARRARIREFGARAATDPSPRRVKFADEMPVPFSPPKWYLDFLEAHSVDAAERTRGGDVTPRHSTPPRRRENRENRENRETATPRWRG